MSLFYSTLARHTDPPTSHQAARAISPHLNELQREALAAIDKWPDQTATELSSYLGHDDPRRLNRRVGELIKAGFIIVSSERLCTVTGHNARTYRKANR